MTLLRRIPTILALLMGAVSVTAAVAQSSSPRLSRLRDSVAQVQGRVIITLKSSGGVAAVRVAGDPPVSLGEQAEIAVRLRDQLGVMPRARASRVAAVFATVNDAQLAALMQDPNVELVEADVLMTLAVEPLESLGEAWRRRTAEITPWGVTKVGAPAAWAAGNTGAGAKIGIIDSGIDNNHPDLTIGGGYDFTTGSSSSTAWDDNIGVCNGHGTHVAGITAAKQDNNLVVGVAPSATVYALKVFEVVSGGCSSWSSNQILALDWAVQNGLDVVNFSLASSTGTVSYQNAVDAAVASGVVVVAATGNNGASTITFPARYSNVIAVAALDANNARAWFSNAGPEVWLAAPGVNIQSTMPGGGTGNKSGTSMAAPHVAGLVALLRSANPSWTVARVRDELRLAALDVDAAGFDNQTGYGLAKAAVAGGPPPPVVTIAVAPGARSTSVQVGGAAASDSATVTLAGATAGVTPWTATKRKAWTTLTTASGTGSGTVRWSRNASGLAAGTYVDTITVDAIGATGSPAVVFDTLRVTAAPPPLTLAVAPAARSTSVQVGGVATGDSATVTLSGTNASTAAWTASKRKAWTTLTTASGIGSGTVRWSRTASGLAAGTYVDTITVTAAGATGSPRTVFDTLRVTAAPPPLTLVVAPAGRSTSVQVGGVATGDSATVTLSGTNASTAAWTASKQKAWTTLTTPNGTGSGNVRWSRNASGLAVGTYVDTITVTAPGATGSPRAVYDTLRVTAPPTPLTLAVSPRGRSATVEAGSAAPNDSSTVTLSGANAATAPWSASKRKAWTTLTTASGTGSGRVRWSRSATGLAVGTYVDTITVSATGAVGSPTTVFDTLRVSAAPVPLTLALSPAARSVSVAAGSAAPATSATVTLSGTNAATTAWTATKRKAWTTLTQSSGTGSGTIQWTRNTSGLAVGVYVDTITVTAPGAAGSPGRVFDTLRITPAIVPLALSVTPAGRAAAIQSGASAPNDSVTVTITGTAASSATWNATRRSTWLTLTTSNGTGPGRVRWSRNAAGLGVGTHVDTITVSAIGVAAPAVVYDTLRVSAAPVPLTLRLTPPSASVTIEEGTAAPGGMADVSLEGVGSASAGWTVSKRQSWTVLSATTGSGSGSLAWQRNTAGLAAGVYVDTISVTLAGAVGSPARIIDSIRVTESEVIVVVLTPSSRSVSAPQGSTGTIDDESSISISGTDAANTTWTATNRAAWSTVTVASGTGSGIVRWTRRADGLAPGVHVDTITVVAGPAAAIVVDTFQIVQAAPPPVTAALSPSSRQVAVVQGAQQPVVDSASVLLSGPAAASTVWSASARRHWTQLTVSSGMGSGTMRWLRDVAALPIGTHVDTITVSVNGVAAAQLYDTVRVVVPSVALRVSPEGRRRRVARGFGQATAVSLDTAVVELIGPAESDAEWIATTGAQWIGLTTTRGPAPGVFTWSRAVETLAPGLHVDSIVVVLASDPQIRAVVRDTIEVVSVATPTPELAAEELFSGGRLDPAQRDALDLAGNRNGGYDLGDFLAWVDRAGIRLSPQMMDRLLSVPESRDAAPTRTPRSRGSR